MKTIQIVKQNQFGDLLKSGSLLKWHKRTVLEFNQGNPCASDPNQYPPANTG